MKKYFSIVKRAYLWLAVAVAGVICSWLVFSLTAQFSEEFTGGVSVVFKGKVEKSEVVEGLTTFLAQKSFPKMPIILEENQETTEIKINARLENDEKVNQLSQLIPLYLEQEGYISSDAEIVDQVVIGPSVGEFMQTTAMKALFFWMLAMIIYMIFSFGAIRHSIAPSILAIVVLLSTLVNISIPVGAYGIWMVFNSTLQVDTVFIIAILTIVGYGINDVIIIFDRVRENMLDQKQEVATLHLFEESLWQSMKRSVGTGVSTLLVLIAMNLFGTGVVATFAFTVGVGVVVSTLSSIFVAVPFAYLLTQVIAKKK